MGNETQDHQDPRSGFVADRPPRQLVQQPKSSVVDGDAARLIVQIWLGSRAVLLLTGLVCALVTGRTFDSIAGNWDVRHFVDIARLGYRHPNSEAFFPGWPILLWVGSKLMINPILVGVLICSIASLAAAFGLARLGGKAGFYAAILWLLAPMTVFTAVPYTEAVFCACAFWAWNMALQRRWFIMGGLAAAASLVRISGLFLLLALLILIVTRPRIAGEPTSQRWRQAMGLALPMLSLAGYACYQKVRTGSWLAWYQAQQRGWARGFHWPWESLINTVTMAGTRDGAHLTYQLMFQLELVAMTAGVVTGIICLLRSQWASACWVLSQCLAFSISYWWMSVNRAVLLWFPLWLLLGQAVAWIPKKVWLRRTKMIAVWVALAVAALGLVGWAWAFYNSWWAS